MLISRRITRPGRDDHHGLNASRTPRIFCGFQPLTTVDVKTRPIFDIQNNYWKLKNNCPKLSVTGQSTDETVDHLFDSVDQLDCQSTDETVDHLFDNVDQLDCLTSLLAPMLSRVEQSTSTVPPWTRLETWPRVLEATSGGPGTPANDRRRADTLPLRAAQRGQRDVGRHFEELRDKLRRGACFANDLETHIEIQ